MKEYNKLIRDKIPQIIEEAGKEYEVRELDEEEYHEKLKEKLQEEVDEYLESNEIEELADILEVIQALTEQSGMELKELEEIRAEKVKERGAFEKRLLLEEVRE